MAKKGTPVTKAGPKEKKRQYLSQADVPGWSLTQALKIPRALADNYGKNPTKPLRVAEALGLSPSSSYFRAICGASIAYGLTEGGYNSELIGLTALGRRIVAPIQEGDDVSAKKEALLRPRVVRDFLTRYTQSRLPTEQIGRNVLEELGVPANRTKAVFDLVIEGARDLGLLRELKGQTYVDIDSMPVDRKSPKGDGTNTASPASIEEAPIGGGGLTNNDIDITVGSGDERALRRSGRVFITHGRNKEIVGQLKDLLTFGGFTPIVAIEQESISKPVSDKVLGDMRSCDAAIIHVGTDMRLMSADGKEHKMLNQNVLIEIGAAMALYGGKFILLVEKGATLPSNLQGLYEVRYEGDKLDYDATMKLLKAFADFRG